MKQTSTNLRSLSLLRDLIAFDTVGRSENPGLIEWARDLLLHLGAKTRLRQDAAGAETRLVATLGDGQLPGLILAAQTRVASVERQEWISPPWRAELRDDRVYGRGSSDMKGFIACALAAATTMAEAGERAPFHLVLAFDEQGVDHGVRSLLDDLADAGSSAAGCIVGRPTGMQAVRCPDAELSPLDQRMSHLLGTRRKSGKVLEAESNRGWFQGVPTVACGPGFKAQARSADEYVALEQLVACNEFLAAMVATQALHPLRAQPALAEALD